MISTLSNDEQWQREDFCQNCFSNLDHPALLATWKVHLKKENVNRLVLSEDAIWQVLYKAADDEALRGEALTFILCLMMMRKRKLRVIKVKKKKGQEIQTFSNKSRKIELDVVVPHLGPVAFSKLQGVIGEFFKSNE